MTKSQARDRATLLQQMGLLDDEQLCLLLGWKPATLRNRRSMGTAPPSSKVGNEHLTKRVEVDAFLRHRRVDNSARAPLYREANAERARRNSRAKAA